MKTITRQDLEDVYSREKRINFKTLCEYAKENIPQFDYHLEETEEHRPRKTGRLLYGGHRLYTGYILHVYPKNSYLVEDGRSYQHNHSGVNHVACFNSLWKFDHHNLVDWILQHIH